MVKKVPSSKIGTIMLSISAMFIILLIQIYLMRIYFPVKMGIPIFTEFAEKFILENYPKSLILLPFHREIILIFLISLLFYQGRVFKVIPFNLPLFVSRVIRDINIYFAIFATISLWIWNEESTVAPAFWITFVFVGSYYLHHDFIIECIAVNHENKVLNKSKENFLENKNLRLSIAGINPEELKVEISSSENKDAKEIRRLQQWIIESGYVVFIIILEDRPAKLEVKKKRNSHDELLASYIIKDLDVNIKIVDGHRKLFEGDITVDPDMHLKEALEYLLNQKDIRGRIKTISHDGKNLDVEKSFEELGLYGHKIYVEVE